MDRHSRSHVVTRQPAPTPAVARLPAIPARSRLGQAWRVVLWTVAWTLFQWWAVIGWPHGPGAVYAAGVLGACLGLAGWDASREVRMARPLDVASAPVIPLAARSPRAAASALQDRAA
jgi:hypothetical protein